MAPDVSSSTTSLGSLDDEGLTTDPDDFSSTYSEDIHIGISSRPQLPPLLSHSSISKSLPSRLPGGIVLRSTGPPLRSQSARSHQICDSQRASDYSPRPQPYPPPPHPRQRHRRPPPPPPPPPPPLTRPVSGTLLQPLDRHDRLRSDLAEPQYSYDDRSHGDDPDSLCSSLHGSSEPETDAKWDPDYVQHLTENYAKLQNQRSAVLAVYNTAKSQRAHVRKLRRSKGEASQKFMTAARALLPDSAELSQLHQLFKAMEGIHLECQKAEQRLEKTIDELHHGQGDLGSQEEAFYKIVTEWLGIPRFQINSDCDSHSDGSEDWALRGITGERPETIHPLYEKLRGAFGALELAKELLENTRMKREALRARKSQPLSEDGLDRLENYGDVGKKKALELRAMALITEEDIEQLREYDILEQDAKQDIEIYTEKVMMLQRECRENGVLPSFSYLQQEGLGVNIFNQNEISLAPGPFEFNDKSATLAHPVFPLILSNPTHLLHGFPQTALQSLKVALQLPLNAPVRAKQVKEAAREANIHALLSTVESEDKSEYINRWLLHKLHHSALEAELLWTTFRSRLKILDIDRWQRDVLQFWWRDNLVDIASIDIGDSETDKTSNFVGSCAEFNMEFNNLSLSDSGQLDGLRTWNLDDSWL